MVYAAIRDSDRSDTRVRRQHQRSAGEADLARLGAVNLNLLVPLLVLLEERSVTRAAERVGLSQPAMSHALNRMRRLFGDELVVRKGSGLVLTPRAAELIDPLRHALQQTASVLNFTEFDPSIDRRVITVAMTINAAFVVGSRLSRLLARDAPHVTLRLRTMMLPAETAFTEEGFDLMLLAEEFSTPFERERLYEDRWVVIASDDAPSQADSLQLLSTLPHVALDASPHRLLPYAILDEHAVPYTIRDFVSDSLLIPNQVALTGGVAIHQFRVAAAMREFFSFRIEEFPFPTPAPSVDLVWNPWLTDEGFKSWLRGLLLEAVTPGGEASGSRYGD